jgi:hypothetical protein
VTVLPRWARRLAQAAGAFLLVFVLVAASGLWGAVLVWSPSGGSAVPPVPGAGSLPAVVAAPQPWTPDATKAPIGAASVLYSSDSWLIDDSDWFLGLVGRDADDYRLAELPGVAGMSSVLSPDGARLAFEEGVVDLATGRETAFPESWGSNWTAPQAWSPDGTTLAVLTGPVDGPDIHLRTLDVSSGAITEIARLSARSAPPGWTAAFSPDGAWLAFHNNDVVRVHALAGGADFDLPLPPGARLAGKGAWTRDGRGLLVVSGEPCRCADHPVSWTITTISASGGTPAGPSYRRDGAYAVRVLGWWPSGRPVVAEYAAARNTGPAPLTYDSDWTGLRNLAAVGSVRLIELGTSRVLMAGDDRLFGGAAESVDVPDTILAAGRLRPGDPPAFGMDTVLVAVLALAAVSVLILLAAARRWVPPPRRTS